MYMAPLPIQAIPAQRQTYMNTMLLYPAQPIIFPDRQKQEFESLKTEAFHKYTKGHKDLAVNYLEKAVSIYPNSTDTLLILGRIYRETKQYDRALQRLMQAKNSQSPVALIDPIPPNQIDIEIGKTYYEMGDFANAEPYLRTQKTLFEMKNTFSPNKTLDTEDSKDLSTIIQYINRDKQKNCV